MEYTKSAITPEQAMLWYIRILFLPDTPSVSHDNQAVTGQGAFRNQIIIRVGEPERRLRTVGCCIYCGAYEYVPGTGEPLHEEHIVARGLDGTLVLKEASCRQCAKQTADRIEGRILKTGMLAPRRQLKIREQRFVGISALSRAARTPRNGL